MENYETGIQNQNQVLIKAWDPLACWVELQEYLWLGILILWLNVANINFSGSANIRHGVFELL